jgi:hypothetical protein
MKTLSLGQMENVNGGMIINPHMCGDLLPDERPECNIKIRFPFPIILIW